MVRSVQQTGDSRKLKTQFAGTQNQSLAAAVLEGIFERLRLDHPNATLRSIAVYPLRRVVELVNTDWSPRQIGPLSCRGIIQGPKKSGIPFEKVASHMRRALVRPVDGQAGGTGTRAGFGLLPRNLAKVIEFRNIQGEWCVSAYI
jgi:hypothetical protein